MIIITLIILFNDTILSLSKRKFLDSNFKIISNNHCPRYPQFYVTRDLSLTSNVSSEIVIDGHRKQKVVVVLYPHQIHTCLYLKQYSYGFVFTIEFQNNCVWFKDLVFSIQNNSSMFRKHVNMFWTLISLREMNPYINE